jgi:outer membrane protein OmpA-like peptidoglycan-associated protein
MKHVAILAAALLFLAGCETPRPDMREPSVTPPVAPQARTDHGHGAARSVARGPVRMLASREVDDYMDRQEDDLRRRLRGSGVRVARIGNDIVVEMRNDVLFARNSSDLSPAALGTVDVVAGVLRRYDRTLVEVNGYTDTTGTPEYNGRLSQHRAEAVANVLVDDGVNPARISPRGFGETHLLIPTGDNVDEPRNRRVQIRVVPHAARS